jgi:hypothetical protein
MKEYMYTKTLGVIVGTLTIFGALGFGLLSLIGSGLSKALNTGHDYTSTNRLAMFILITLLLFGLITVIVSLRLKSKAWDIIFIGFCFMLGIGFVIAFLISFGSIGTKSEIFILFIGIIYFLLGYLAIKKK